MDATADQEKNRIIQISSSLGEKRIILIVEDNGSGVSGDLSEKIFEPFFTTKEYSTGIGLSLCHRIITDHNGTMKVMPADLGGARFIIELPFYKTVSENKTIKPECKK